MHHQNHPQGKIFNKHYYNATIWDQQQHEWQKQNESGIQGIDVCTTTMQLLTLLCLSQFLTESEMTCHSTPSLLTMLSNKQLKMVLNLSRDLQAPAGQSSFHFK